MRLAILMVGALLGLACSSDGSSDGGNESSVWKCQEVTGSLGPVICSCQLAAPGKHDSLYTDPTFASDSCVQSTRCCQLAEDKDECDCYPNSSAIPGISCEEDAAYVHATVVDSCPP